MSCHFKHRVFGLPGGTVAVEFVLIVPILLVLVFGIIDFGRFVWTREVLTEVSRLGGSLVFSRDKEFYLCRDIENTEEATELLDLLQDAGSPILRDDNKNKWKIVVSKIEAAQQQGDSPTIAKQVEEGNLNVNSAIGEQGFPPNQDALQYLYSHLDYTAADDLPDKNEIGVVEVFYKYEPITPLPNFIEGILQMDDGGVIIESCKAFF